MDARDEDDVWKKKKSERVLVAAGVAAAACALAGGAAVTKRAAGSGNSSGSGSNAGTTAVIGAAAVASAAAAAAAFVSWTKLNATTVTTEKNETKDEEKEEDKAKEREEDERNAEKKGGGDDIHGYQPTMTATATATTSASKMLQKWAECAEIVSSIANDVMNSVRSEDELGKQNHPLVLNVALLDTLRRQRQTRVNEGDEEGVMTPPQHQDIGVEKQQHKRILSPALVSDASRFLRYASAVYGAASLAALYMWEGRDIPAALVAEETDRKTVSLYCSIAETDVIDVSEMRGGIERPGWMIAIDRERSAIVLAIRGTASLTDGLVHDLMCQDESFLTGVAHAGFASAAKAVASAVRPRLKQLYMELPETTSFELIITGHSLGAGVAGLLTLLLLEDDEAGMTTFLYAPPPMFLGKLHKRVASCITAFVNPRDVVPHLSIERFHATLELLLAIDAMPLTSYERLAIITGMSPAPPDLLDKVEKDVLRGSGVIDGEESCKDASLSSAKAAPFSKLAIPGKICLLSTPPVLVNGTEFADYDVPLGLDMISDHMVSAYAPAIARLGAME